MLCFSATGRIHTTADRKNAPYAYDEDKHWEDIVTNEADEPWNGQELKIVLTSTHTWLSRIEARSVCEPIKDNRGKRVYKPIFCPSWVNRGEFAPDKSPNPRTCRTLIDLNKKYPRLSFRSFQP